jgi:hypothetical protein
MSVERPADGRELVAWSETVIDLKRPMRLAA